MGMFDSVVSGFQGAASNPGSIAKTGIGYTMGGPAGMLAGAAMGSNSTIGGFNNPLANLQSALQTGAGYMVGGPAGAAIGSQVPKMFTGPGMKGAAGSTPDYDPNAANAGKPADPTFWSAMGDNGQLQDKYSLANKIKTLGGPASIQGDVDSRLGGANINQDALEAMRGEIKPGNSAWLNSALAQSNAQLGQNLSDTAASSAGNAANARSNLAMSHGLSSGAAERLGTLASRDSMAAQQGLRGQNMLGNMNLQTQDQANKLGMMGQLAGAEQNLGRFNLQKAGMGINNLQNEQQMGQQANMYNTQAANAAQGTDLQTKLSNLGAQNNFNQGLYGNHMTDWAAQKNAEGIANNKTSGGIMDKFDFTKWLM